MSKARATQLVEAGMWLRLSGDHEGAKRLFDQALKLDPDNARARQLLAGGPDEKPGAPVAPAAPLENPFAPAPVATAMDLDWGIATGFAKTPAPFVPPPQVAPPPAPPGFGDGGTLVFGGLSAEAALAEPEVHEASATMLFTPPSRSPPAPAVVPWGGTPAPSALTPIPPGPASGIPGSTMQFPKLNRAPAPAAPPPVPTGGTMQFTRPAELSPPSPEGLWAEPIEDPAPSGGTMQFAPPEPGPAREDPWVEPVQEAPVPKASEPRFAFDATSAWDQRSNPGIKLSELTGGAALDLVTADRSAAAPPVVKSKLDEVRTLVRGAKDLLNLDDHTGAMDLILKAQELAPNDPEVIALRAKSESTLGAMFESKLGDLSKVPRVKLKDDEIIWLNLDHRAGFVLAQIDGSVTFEDLFSVSGMSRLDTARILAQLVEEGVITAS